MDCKFNPYEKALYVCNGRKQRLNVILRMMENILDDSLFTNRTAEMKVDEVQKVINAVRRIEHIKPVIYEKR